MHVVGKIDTRIFDCVAKQIVSDEVIITQERIAHIEQRHPEDYQRFFQYLPEILANPDYIIESKKPSTAVVLKEIIRADEKFKVIVRIQVEGNPSGYKNSILSFWRIGETTWNKEIKNKKVIYKAE